MKKFLLASCTIALLVLSGCQQIKEQAENLRKEGESTINSFSQQAESMKTKVLETKAAYEEKSQQVVNAVDAVNKLTK